MYLNERSMSPELLYYKALEARTILNNIEKRKLKILERGFQGECLYDKIFDQVGMTMYIFLEMFI